MGVSVPYNPSSDTCPFWVHGLPSPCQGPGDTNTRSTEFRHLSCLVYNLTLPCQNPEPKDTMSPGSTHHPSLVSHPFLASVAITCSPKSPPWTRNMWTCKTSDRCSGRFQTNRIGMNNSARQVYSPRYKFNIIVSAFKQYTQRRPTNRITTFVFSRLFCFSTSSSQRLSSTHTEGWQTG